MHKILILSVALVCLAFPAMAQTPTWVNTGLTGLGAWFGVAISQNGSVIAAVQSSDGAGNDAIELSTDGGATWRSVALPFATGGFGYGFIAVSSSGSTMLAGPAGGAALPSPVEISTDTGSTWSTYSFTAGFNGSSPAVMSGNAATKVVGAYLHSGSITYEPVVNSTIESFGTASGSWIPYISRDGTTILATNFTPAITEMLSHDSGSTWSSMTSGTPNGDEAGAINSDGTVLVMYEGDSPTELRRSTDGGASFSNLPAAGTNFYYVALSDDGSAILAGRRHALLNYITLSCDSGTSFMDQPGPGRGAWVQVAIAGDKSRAVAVNEGGTIWVTTGGGVCGGGPPPTTAIPHVWVNE